METRILTLFTRTPLHVGAGSSVGAVDQPIVRERHTRFPVIPGSSLKGVLRDLWPAGDAETLWLFGTEQGEREQGNFVAGALLLGEARLLAFPVRSAKGGFAWLTCPLALARFKRDAGAAFAVPEVSAECCFASPEVLFEEDMKVVLEDYCLQVKGQVDAAIVGVLAGIATDDVWANLGKRLVIVSDEMLSYFAENACEVVTRVRIDDETGTVARGALFNQEQVPSEALFYAAVKAQPQKGKDLAARKDAEAALAALEARLADPDVGSTVQIGGDETIGLGWCSAKFNSLAE